MKNKSLGQTLNISPTHRPRFKLYPLSLYLMVCLLTPKIAGAAFWVDSFSGAPEDYRIVRQGKKLKVEGQLYLVVGDQVSVLSETGIMRLIQDDTSVPDKNRLVVLSKKNPTFKIPESEAPPGIISNMVALAERWISQVSEEEVETSVMATRGEGPVLLSGASDLENQLMEGFESLVVYWSGGEPPYKIRLLDDDDKVIVEKNNIQGNDATLTDINIPAGEYGLKVLGKSSSSYIALVVVGKNKVPALYTTILNSRAPDKVKQSYAVLAFASHSTWLFQSLQLAERYDLQNIKQNILSRNIPDPIDESQF